MKIKKNNTRYVSKIITHCSDSDYDHHNDISVIRKWHVDERGWSDVGYHYFIKRNGEVQEGRPLRRPGAHTKGHNRDSIGICLHGRNNFTNEQFFSWNKLCSLLMTDFNLSEDDFYGHKDFSNKTCPNFDVQEKLNLEYSKPVKLRSISKLLNIRSPKL